MEGGVKGDLPHAKYREEGATNALPPSARWGRTAGTVWWQIVMILCLNQQQTCPGEWIPHVDMYGPGDSASVMQGPPT